MITAMAAYIDSLINLRATPVVQVPQPFYPSSVESQQLMKQVQRSKLLIDVMGNWINSLIQDHNKFIFEFTGVYAEGETLSGEIQTLVPIWETELAHCQAVVFQVIEVEHFGVLKFLNRNPMKSVDPCMLFYLEEQHDLERSYL